MEFKKKINLLNSHFGSAFVDPVMVLFSLCFVFLPRFSPFDFTALLCCQLHQKAEDMCGKIQVEGYVLVNVYQA